MCVYVCVCIRTILYCQYTMRIILYAYKCHKSKHKRFKCGLKAYTNCVKYFINFQKYGFTLYDIIHYNILLLVLPKILRSKDITLPMHAT